MPRRQTLQPSIPEYDSLMKRRFNIPKFDGQLVLNIYIHIDQSVKTASVYLNAHSLESNWNESSEAIENHYGLDRNIHSFAYEPERAFSMLERQATSGFRYYLHDCPEEIRKERISAFIKAALQIGRPPKGLKELPKKQENNKTANEYQAFAEEERIDLFVSGPLDGNKGYVAVIVEAKFGHTITKGQLPNYRNAANDKMGFNKEAQIPIVIGKSLRKADKEILTQKRQRDWRFIKWQDFLRLYEMKLAAKADDEAFCRFRRNILYKAVNR